MGPLSMRTEPRASSMSPPPLPPQQLPPPPQLPPPLPLSFPGANLPRTTSDGCSRRPLPMFRFRSPDRSSRAGVCRDPAAATTTRALTTRRTAGPPGEDEDEDEEEEEEEEEEEQLLSKGSGDPAGSGVASTPTATRLRRDALASSATSPPPPFPGFCFLLSSSSTRSAIVPVRISAPARAASARKVCVWSCLSPVGQPPKQQRPQSAAAAGEEGATAQLRGTRPACCPRAASPSASLELGPLCGGGGGKGHEGEGEEEEEKEEEEKEEEEEEELLLLLLLLLLLPKGRRPPPQPNPTRMREQTAARALSNLERPSSSPLPLATGRPPTALHSSRTWSGVGKEAHQLILVPPPRVEPASAVAERSREEHRVPRSYVFEKALSERSRGSEEEEEDGEDEAEGEGAAAATEQ